MGKLLMRGYWVLIIGVGFLYGVLAALAAGFILLPFVLGGLQRSMRSVSIDTGGEEENEGIEVEDGIKTITLSGDIHDMINPLAISSSKF